MISKLDSAIKSLDKDNETAACGQLTAFVNNVNALTDKKISEEQADQMFDVLLSIVDSFNNECTGVVQSIGK